MTVSLLHISDIHFGPPHLHGRFIALKELAKHADAVVISGDITQRAKSLQFKAAREGLENFGKPYIAVPGNHDIPLYPLHLRLFAPYLRWRRYFGLPLSSTLKIGNALICAFNSAHGLTVTEGRIRADQLKEIKRQLLRSSPSDFRIVMLHHPLLGLPGDSRDRSIHGSERLIRLLASHPVDLILAGHVHRTVWQDVQDLYTRFPYSLPVVHTGTATTNRSRGKERSTNSCQMITIERERFTIQRYTFEDSGFQPEAHVTHPRHNGRAAPLNGE